jgi:hypothetical protein
MKKHPFNTSHLGFFQSRVTIQIGKTDGEVFVYDAGRGHDVRDELVIAGPLAIPAILDAE